MNKDLFENIVNDVVTRMLNEALINPTDNTKDVINTKAIKKGNSVAVMVFSDLADTEIKQIAQVNPKMISPNGLRAKVVVDPAKIPAKDDMPNIPDPAAYSPDMKSLLEFCSAITNLKTYGTVDLDEVLDEVHFAATQVLSDQDKVLLGKSEDQLFQELLDNLKTPRGKSLVKSLSTYFPIKSLDHRNSSRNISRILAADQSYVQEFTNDNQVLNDGDVYFYEKDGLYPRGQVSGGQTTVGQLKQQLGTGILYQRPPATFVAKPQDWREMYNRKVSTNAKPYWLLVPVRNNVNVTDNDLEAGVRSKLGDETQGFLGNQSARGKYGDVSKNKNTQGTRRFMKYAGKQAAQYQSGKYQDFDYFPYYDICDTYVINGQTDEFFSDERIGVLDNIKWVPTAAGAKQAAKQMGIDPNAADVNQQIDKKRDEFNYNYANQVFNALQTLAKSTVTLPPNGLDANGKPKSNILQKLIMDLLKKYLYDDLLAKLISYPKNREEKAKWIAILFAAAHNVAPDLVWNEYSTLNKVDASDSAIASVFNEKYMTNKNIYSTLCRNINNRIKNMNVTPKAAGSAMEESREYNDNLYEQHLAKFNQMLNEHRFDSNCDLLKETHTKIESKFYRLLERINNTKL